MYASADVNPLWFIMLRLHRDGNGLVKGRKVGGKRKRPHMPDIGL